MSITNVLLDYITFCVTFFLLTIHKSFRIFNDSKSFIFEVFVELTTVIR